MTEESHSPDTKGESDQSASGSPSNDIGEASQNDGSLQRGTSMPSSSPSAPASAKYETDPSYDADPIRPWQAWHAVITGPGHWKIGKPCQDSAGAATLPRPIAVTSDGKGSAQYSEHGSRTLVERTLSIARDAQLLLSVLLDSEDLEQVALVESPICHLFQSAWQHAVREVSSHLGVPAREVEATICVVVVGSVRTLCMQVGDGAVVGIQGHGHAHQLLVPYKGRFASQTCFVKESALAAEEFSQRLVSTEDYAGFACMSDGVSEKLVSAKTGRADGIAELAASLVRGCREDYLTSILADESIFTRRFQDDRSLAILAAGQ